MITIKPLSDFLSEYVDRNIENKYPPVAVGRYGIRTRESIYSKELAKDYSKNKLIRKDTLTVGMGSNQVDIGILSDDKIYSVSPAYHTYNINGINVDYLRYCLEHRNQDMFIRYAKRGSRQGKTIDFSRWLNYVIPVYSEEIQSKIVIKLNKISFIIRKKEELLKLYDQLARSLFIEMFGDPVENPKKWNISTLLTLGSCKNGMNFHIDDFGVEINCIGVGDFKDYDVISNTHSLPIVSLNSMPTEDYLLKDEDIVFVRSNGNKTMVGRSIVIYPGKNLVTFSGFCIRYRNEDSSIMVPYLLRVVKTESIRMQMYGRGANIQNLNQKILASLKIPIPPMNLQEKFVQSVSSIDKSKLAVKKSLEELEILKKSLMQKYFA